eukprot:g14200.t1
MKVIQFVAAALVAAPCAAFFAPVGTNSFVTRQRAAARSTTAVRMAETDLPAELVEEVIEVVGEQLEKKGAVTIDSNFIEDLDADSLDTVELIMSLEERFGMDIPEDDAQKMTTVKDAVEYIAQNNQNPAAQGLQPASWMYTSHTAKRDSLDFDFGTCFSQSSSEGLPSPGSPPLSHQPWKRGSTTSSTDSVSISSSIAGGNVVEHHHHHHHHHHAPVGTTMSPSTLPMTPPPGLSHERFGRHASTATANGGTVTHTHTRHASPHSILAAMGARAGTSRSSSVESDSSSALGLYGGIGVSSSSAAGGVVGAPCAFQISGYRTVELLPTAQQRQTLQKWFGVVRWIHNRAVDALRVDSTASATKLRATVAESESEHEWAAAVPLAIRDATVAQLVGALHLAQRSAEVAAAATGEAVMAEPIGTAAQNKALKYRTRKDRLEQIVLRADGFQYGIPYPDYFGYAPLAASAPIPERLPSDAILVRSTERFYLCIPDSC